MTEEQILDAKVEVFNPHRCRDPDPILVRHDLTKCPSGTVLFDRQNNWIISYHANDVHAHSSILIWFTDDGKVLRYYEPCNSKPLLIDLMGKSITCSVELREIIVTDYNGVCGYVPKPEVVNHPRFLETLERLVKIIPPLFMVNFCFNSFANKYAPLVFEYPLDMGFQDPYLYYRELETKENPLLYSHQNPRILSNSCVDIVMLFVSILHEDLFIKLTPEEKDDGQIPEKSRIFQSYAAHDGGRMIAPGSDFYKIYEEQPLEIYKRITRYNGNYNMYIPVFLLPFILGLCFFCLVYFLRNSLYTPLRGTLHRSLLHIMSH